MENLLIEDRSAELDALHAELKAKLPEEQLCAMTTMYGLLDILIGGNSLDLAEHLFADHRNLTAGELVLSFLRFLDSAGRVEAACFHDYDIQGIRRFDVTKNAETLAEFEDVMNTARVEAAMLEGANHVKH